MNDNYRKAIFEQGKIYREIAADCKVRGIRFEDDQFPAVDSSVYFSVKHRHEHFQWKRPGEVSQQWEAGVSMCFKKVMFEI